MQKSTFTTLPAKHLDEVRLSSSVTVKKYYGMELAQDRDGLASLIQERLLERYVLPLSSSSHKHGFSMMATSCLLIETLESFYRGWEDTSKGVHRKDIETICRPIDPKRSTVSASEIAFCYFFHRFSCFAPLQSSAQPFYEHVRCGILHQGETTGGWRILRKGDLFDATARTVNATEFLKQVELAVQAYAKELRKTEWNNALWINFRNKMKSIIDNCHMV